MGCNYEDDAGVKDAAKEVRNLKKNGIRVGAILFGSHDASKEARIIYENEYVSILLGTCVILEIVRCDYGK